MSRIRYSLRKNPFSKDEDHKYMATVRKSVAHDQDDLIKLMLRRNTTLTRQDITGVISLMNEVMADEVISGNTIVTDLFKVGVSIKGGFRSEREVFNSKKHPICVHMNPTRKFKEMVAHKASVRRIDPLIHHPNILALFDYVSQAYGKKLHEGGLVAIKGMELLSCGDYVNISLSPKGSKVRYPITKIHEVSNSNILFTLPDELEAGEYELKVEMGEKRKKSDHIIKEGITILRRDSEDSLQTKG